MKKIILVKLGGSLITKKGEPFTEKPGTIRRLVGEIKNVRGKSNTSLIIGHGGGSYPHVPAIKYKTNEGILNEESFDGIARVQDAAARLNRVVVGEFLKSKVNAVSLNPSSFMISDNGRVEKSFLAPLYMLLEYNMLPVVYGDVCLDTRKGCTILSTEQILSHLAEKLNDKFRIEKIIYCGITDGVYDAEGKRTKKITQSNISLIRERLKGSAGIDVTGGMLHKVQEALSVSGKLGIEVQIINGRKKGNLEKATSGVNVEATRIIG
jgi:isopentenyl phosphate kinase